jgi:hypothetical protein
VVRYRNLSFGLPVAAVYDNTALPASEAAAVAAVTSCPVKERAASTTYGA